MSQVWDNYSERLQTSNNKARSQSQLFNREFYSRHIPNSLAYKEVRINGFRTEIAVIDSTEMSVKKIYSMPGKTLEHGGLVQWENSIWLITEVDKHAEIYTKGKMTRCNYLLKWIDRSDDNAIQKECWCVVTDTSALLGEEQKQMMTVGDARTTLTIPKNDDTRKFTRGMRFIIDDPDTDKPLAYEITKPIRLHNVYDKKGVYKFLLHEVNTTDQDNLDLLIADYYITDFSSGSIQENEVWL